MMMLHGVVMHRLLNKKQSPLGRAIAAACLEACMTLLESARQGNSICDLEPTEAFRLARCAESQLPSASGMGPGCVKTRSSGECAELSSLFSSFDGDCQSGSFVIQRNGDKLSTRKFDVGFSQRLGQSHHFDNAPITSGLPRKAVTG